MAIDIISVFISLISSNYIYRNSNFSLPLLMVLVFSQKSRLLYRLLKFSLHECNFCLDISFLFLAMNRIPFQIALFFAYICLSKSTVPIFTSMTTHYALNFYLNSFNFHRWIKFLFSGYGFLFALKLISVSTMFLLLKKLISVLMPLISLRWTWFLIICK